MKRSSFLLIWGKSHFIMYYLKVVKLAVMLRHCYSENKIYGGKRNMRNIPEHSIIYVLKCVYILKIQIFYVHTMYISAVKYMKNKYFTFLRFSNYNPYLKR